MTMWMVAGQCTGATSQTFRKAEPSLRVGKVAVACGSDTQGDAGTGRLLPSDIQPAAATEPLPTSHAGNSNPWIKSNPRSRLVRCARRENESI
jgi:hypothetical protein